MVSGHRIMLDLYYQKVVDQKKVDET